MPGWPFGGQKRPRYFACVEYWLYLPKPKLPPQDAYMTRMLRLNPFRMGDTPPCGPLEALLFSDIRLHISLVLREKNAHVFRPDLFESHISPTPEMLAILAESTAFVKLRYLSESKLQDDRHLQFMPYLLESLAHLTNAKLAFDTISERLLLLTDMRQELSENEDAKRPEFHSRVIWRRTERGGIAASRGLVKIGLPEIETPESPAEHEVLLKELVSEAMLKIWAQRDYPTQLQLRAFDDEFRADMSYAKRGPTKIRIHRIHS